MTKFRSAVATEALEHALGGRLAGRLQTDFGVEPDFRAGRAETFEFSADDRRGFEKAQRSHPVDIRELFVDKLASSRGGFVGGLLDVLDLARLDLRGVLNELA